MLNVSTNKSIPQQSSFHGTQLEFYIKLQQWCSFTDAALLKAVKSSLKGFLQGAALEPPWHWLKSTDIERKVSASPFVLNNKYDSSENQCTGSFLDDNSPVLQLLIMCVYIYIYIFQYISRLQKSILKKHCSLNAHHCKDFMCADQCKLKKYD